MAQFAPVAPPRILQELKDAGHLGKYHLLLAHDIVENPNEYITVFKGLNEAFVIIDNSVVELGKPAPAEMMIEAGELIFDVCGVGGGCIVLPDHIGNGPATLEAIQECEYLNLRYPKMVIPQGQGLADFMWYSREIMEFMQARGTRPEYIGVPRALTEDYIGSRWGATRHIHAKYPDVGIHQFGFSDNLADDILCSRLPGVIGIDSAVPVRLGLHGIKLEDNSGEHPPRGDYWEQEEINENVLLNLQWIREQVGDE